MALLPICAAVLLCGSLADPALADDDPPECFPPGAPEVPDGRSASYPVMVRAQQQMKLYRESAEKYARCMTLRLEQFGGRVPTRRRERWARERQEFAQSVQQTTESYNAAVRLFQRRIAAEQPDSRQPAPVEATDPAPSEATGEAP